MGRSGEAPGGHPGSGHDPRATPTEHVVVTRFNLDLAFASHPPDDLAWLEQRWAPFLRHCLPSMAAQRAPHRWIVLLHEETPGAFRDRFARLGHCEAVYLAPPHDVAGVGDAVRSVLSPGWAGRLVTTRLDADDGLHPACLREVRRASARIGAPGFVNLPVGLQRAGGSLRWLVDRANPFLSHVEDIGEGESPQTAYRVAHEWAARVAPVTQLWRPPRWLQVVHGANEISRSAGYRRPLPWSPGWTAPAEG